MSGLLVMYSLAGALLYVYRASWTTAQYEFAQRHHWDLAASIAKQFEPHLAPVVDELELNRIARQLLLYNPGIDIHIVDSTGRITASFTESTDSLSRFQIPLEPIQTFLSEASRIRLPLYGEDPYLVTGKSVFSAARMHANGRAFYLYIVLLNRQALHSTNLTLASEAFRSAGYVTLFLLVIAALIGRALVVLTTNRFSTIMVAVDRLRHGDYSTRAPESGADELGRLAFAINKMADRITDDIVQLREKDSRRRELIANIWHDVRTPVAGISSLAQSLQRVPRELSEDESVALQSVIANADVLARILGELEELGKLELAKDAPELQPGSLLSIVDDLLLIYRLTAMKRGINLSLNTPESVPKVMMNRTMITRAIGNLVENALRHTPPGGSVTIVVEPAPRSVRVSVEDSGTGIDPKDMPHIFNREYQSPSEPQEARGSSGLGLAIVQKIIENHGGSIRAESHRGLGTKFHFELSLAA